MLAPVGAGAPLVLGLAAGEVLADLHLVEARTAGHGVLVRQNVTLGAQPTLVACKAQAARQREATAVGEAREGDAHHFQRAQPVAERQEVGVGLKIHDRFALETFGPVVGAEAHIGHDHAHAASPLRTMRPFTKWMPHSSLS